jgi:hypothetical protein
MLLSNPIPLRTSEAINAFRETAPLPWWYGDLRNSPQAVVQLSDAEFLAADHAMQITGVQIDGQNVQGFSSGTRTDAQGVTYTVITLSAPLPTGAQITATGLGLAHARTGELIENPADVLESLFTRSGYTVTANLTHGLYQLRSQCAAEGLKIGGRVAFAVTLRETINGIMRSIAGGWCSSNFWLYPSTAALATLPATAAERLPGCIVGALVATLDQTFSRLQIKFDDQSYAAAHRQSLTLRARPSLGEGNKTVTLFAPWLRSSHAATQVARRILTRASGAAYVVTIQAAPVTPPVVIGEVVTVRIHEPGLTGLHPVTIISAERISAATKFTTELVLPQPALAFDVVSRTVAGAITQLDGVEVKSTGTEHQFIVTDDAGKPVLNASVSLDQGPARRTNAQGIVTFVADHGTHTLYVTKPGKLPVAITVEL